MQNEVTSESHAKIIFLGEHSAVYKKPALVFPVPEVKVFTTISETSLTDHQIKSDYYSGPSLNLPTNMAGTNELIKKLDHLLNVDNLKFNIIIKSEIPLACGMGSSAATSASLIKAYFKFFNMPLADSKLNDLINFEEKITHGNPSGIDAKTVVSNTPILFENQKFSSFNFNMNGYIVISDSGVSSDTKIAVEKVHSELENNPSKVNDLINDLGNLVIQAKKSLTTNNIYNLGKLMNQAQQDLKNLNVSSPDIDKLTNIALKNGAIGAKLTGSGLGGCIIALTTDKRTATQVKDNLLKGGSPSVWIQSLAEMSK
ncbi:mevalonate kinase [Fructilactobacillus vespulae]|uniref:mevalonate kinase n=1 Tax=Fructilactobacillus vespulae TaxID=1249630 RepID=UPI0039B5B8FA